MKAALDFLNKHDINYVTAVAVAMCRFYLTILPFSVQYLYKKEIWRHMAENIAKKSDKTKLERLN